MKSIVIVLLVGIGIALAYGWMVGLAVSLGFVLPLAWLGSLVRYVRSGRYDLDRRLRSVTE